MFPFLSLEDVELDVDLAQRLPRRLAYYHLALPIAQDDNSITMAMVHPENQKVVTVLEAVLDAEIIPVRSSAETIRQQLDHVWQIQRTADPLRVLYWSQTAEALERSAWYIDLLMGALERKAKIERINSATFLTDVEADLVVAATDAGAGVIPEALFRTSASLLVLQNPVKRPSVMLHLLRGHIPDYHVLDWLAPLARQSGAEVTLFMGVDGAQSAQSSDERKPLFSDLSNILMARDKRQAHIAECRRILNDLRIPGRLKLRQQSLLTAVEAELTTRPYDLVAMAAEAYGDFALQVGKIVQQQASAFLVIKP